MKKKIISVLVIMSAIVAILLGCMISYANQITTPLTVKLEKVKDGLGYGVGDPTKQSGKNIYHILSFDSENQVEERDLYCVRAEYSATWENTQTATDEVTYNLKYDLQVDRDYLANNLKTDPKGVVASLITVNGGQYEQLLWLLDNMHIAGDTEGKDVLLEKIGIFKGPNGYYTYKTDDGYKYQAACNSVLTDEDIIAVQRVAIWKFTNGGIYSLDSTQKNWLNVTTGQNTETGEYTYDELRDVDGERNEQANLLYQYLITSASAPENIAKYENYTLQGNQVTVDTEGLEEEVVETADGNYINYILQTKIVNGKYVTGPITISDLNDMPYDIQITVTDDAGNVDFDFVDANGVEIANATIESLVNRENGFYIATNNVNSIDELNISINVKQEKTAKTLWLAGDETIDAQTGETEITLDGEQPIVEIVKEEDTQTTNFIVKPFDLALRKYITAVQKVNEDGTVATKTIENERNLNNISLDTLITGTTATYKHRKDPVVVEEDDIVTYTLRIYNEGSKGGYATKIIDQLPTGLILVEDTSKEIVSIGKDGNAKNKYTLKESTTLTTTNQIVLKIVNTEANPAQSLNPYTPDNLDYETIQVKCKVIQKASGVKDDKITLTNVAWIDEAYDADANKVISTEGTLDRDSQPQNSPNVDKDMDKTINYIGNSSNKTDLADDLYHYAGEQDDDDFEKIVIMPIVKKFDLALVKFIVAVSDDEVIEDGEYSIEEDGTYSRAPEVKYNSKTGKLEYDFTNRGAKNPLIVEPGDYVLYNIRVYNEGELDGYAAEVKDHLPVGLEFVETTDKDAEYYGIWNVDRAADENGDEKQILSTNYLAQGQGKEFFISGANLLKAFDKDGELTDAENRNPDYRDVQVLCRVKEDAQKNGVLINYAQISKHTDKDGNNEIEDDDSTPGNLPDGGPGGRPYEDDEDYEKIKLQYFDLSLRKFVTAVNGKELKDSDGKYTRAPVVDVKPLQEGETTAIYTHTKQPVSVQVGDKVVYTIRVYNEGDFNGFAPEVKDYLPPYLTYVEDSKINKDYMWQISEDGRIATTSYLENTELEKFNGTELDYADIKIECMVSDDAPLKQNQTNIAEIAEYRYNGNTVENDIDSTADNMVSSNKLPSDTELPIYKNEEINNSYVPGNQDDDDFEKIYVQEFDLALRKFITKVQETEVTARVPQVDVTPLKEGKGTATYTHPKDALTVHVGDVVTYTLRIYNEGEISGYAGEITDDIPEYLEYLPEDSTNVEYKWKMYDENGKETENVSDAVKVKTTYLSIENGENNLINAYDGETLSYKDIKIAFKVKDPNSNTYIITNYAQISNDTDENGNAVEDKDSTPDEWIDNEQHKDDDQDIENVKVEYFDLSLLKFVSKVIVIEDGKETITETGYNGHENPEPVVKVELHKKKLNNVVVKFGYGITITNEGDIPGYATEITDYVPEGLKFEAVDNPNWTDEGNNVISTKQLENTLLQPGESKTIEVIFTWINSPDNLAQKTNTAEISEDKNEFDVPDRDSTPDNKVEGEDDIDIAKVILAISTGAAQTYFTLTLGLLAVVLVGVILIKKFVI